MKTMTEREKKHLLTEEQYRVLLERFGQGKPVFEQVNYYFDTDDLAMNRRSITCRIRLKNGRYKGTIKRHRTGTDHSTETEIEVRDGIRENAFVDMGLHLKGQLVTERHVIQKDAYCEVVLDKNDYLGITDYELEVEYLPGGETAAGETIRAIAEVLQCGTHVKRGSRDSAKSKSERFFRKLLESILTMTEDVAVVPYTEGAAARNK